MRLRICLLLIMFLRQMGAKTAIDNDLHDLISNTMLHLRDKTPGLPKETVLDLTDSRNLTAEVIPLQKLTAYICIRFLCCTE